MKIGDPVVHTRLMVLDQRRDLARASLTGAEVDAILRDVSRIRQPRPHHRPTSHGSSRRPTGLLRGVTTPEQLAVL